MTRSPTIVVVGSLNMDIVVESDRLPQAGDTMFGNNVRFVPGGKGANQAVGLSKLGARVAMIGAVGQDAFGDQIVRSMEQIGVGMAGVKRLQDKPTGIASILLTEGDNRILVIPGANSCCLPQDIDRNRRAIQQADLVLVQLEIPLKTVMHAVSTAKELNKKVILNPAPAMELPAELLRNVDCLTPNRLELAAVSKMNTEGDAVEEAMRSLQRLGVKNVVTTLGSQGCAYATENGDIGRLPGYRVTVADTTGAGDAFNAGLAYSVAAGSPLPEAVVFAGKTAALSVTKFGAQGGMPTLQEVLEFGRNPTNADEK